MTMLGRKILPDIQVLRENFELSQQGGLKWKVSPRYGIPAGAAAGNVGNHGYLTVKLKGINYLAHRLVYKLATGEEPPDVLDHENHVRTDNLPKNLSTSSYAKNNRNRSLGSNNKSGYLGVTLVKATQKWRADIKLGGKQVELGRFADINDAIAARRAAEIKAGCYHPNHGGAAITSQKE